jgi:inhibitor of cysteine peptidase
MRRAALLALALLAAGCMDARRVSDVDPPGFSGRQPGLLHVDSIDILTLESFPVQITAQVKGLLPDGCTRVEAVHQTRDGNRIDVTITTVRTGEVCTQIVVLATENVRLEGSFPPGDYVVRINGVEKGFRT